MDFLKEILGEELFAQVAEKINAHNGNEANKDKQIKLANLGLGEYVGKGKYDADIEKLNNLLAGKNGELEQANGLILELKNGTKGNEELQGKIKTYETETIPNLQKQLVENKTTSALKFALLSAKALDIYYLSYKVNEKLRGEGRTLELDENENIKGWDDLLSKLKTQHPTMFEAAKGGTVEPNPLPPRANNNSGVTHEEFAKMGYQSRLKLKQEQPEVYAQMTGKATN